MVKIIDCKKRINSEGEEFFSLIVQGGVEPVKAKPQVRFIFQPVKLQFPQLLMKIPVGN